MLGFLLGVTWEERRGLPFKAATPSDRIAPPVTTTHRFW